MHLLGEGPQAQDFLDFASALTELQPALIAIDSFSRGREEIGSAPQLFLKGSPKHWLLVFLVMELR